MGVNIRGLVCDGLKGLRNSFLKYKFQLYQFHIMQYVRIKLTSHPKTQPAIELLSLTNEMCAMDKESFVGLFKEWETK